MTSQIPLLDWSPGARASDPDTSHMAAARALKIRHGDQQRVLHLLAHQPAGLHDFEIADALKGAQTSLGKRRGELRDKGLVYDTGIRRRNSSGSMCAVWALTAAGLARARAAA